MRERPRFSGRVAGVVESRERPRTRAFHTTEEGADAPGTDPPMLYELMNKDVPVLRFSYDSDRHAVAGLELIMNADYAPPSILGLDMSISTRSVAYWWEHRALPASRDQLDMLVSTLGVECGRELLEHNMGLSLSDRYWVRPHGSDLRWADVNFFDNAFSDELGALTLLPGSPAREDGDIDLMSPNSSVDGNVPKKWVMGPDGTRWLLKAGNKTARQDVYNEVVATDLYRRALCPGEYVPYRLVGGDEAAFCACPNFLGEDEELVPACDLLLKHRREEGFGTLWSVLSALGESGLELDYLRECLTKVFSLDYLMANADRHTGNFGLVRDCVTLEYKRFAPIYDTGFSLWCDAYSLSRPTDYFYRPRPFTGRASESPERQIRLFDQYGWLPDIDLEGWRDAALEILSTDPYLPERRLLAIGKGIDANIEWFHRHVERMARLFPANAPSWLDVPAAAAIPGVASHRDALSSRCQPNTAAGRSGRSRRHR